MNHLEFRGTEENPYHISCGGVVFRTDKDRDVGVLLLRRRKSKTWPYGSWHLPKGTRRTTETEEETVIREVLEETGYEVEPIKKLGQLESTYTMGDTTIYKTTFYYVCRPIGRVSKGDTEHNEVKWVLLRTAIKRVSEFPKWEKEEYILSRFEREYLKHSP